MVYSTKSFSHCAQNFLCPISLFFSMVTGSTPIHVIPRSVRPLCAPYNQFLSSLEYEVFWVWLSHLSFSECTLRKSPSISLSNTFILNRNPYVTIVARAICSKVWRWDYIPQSPPIHVSLSLRSLSLTVLLFVVISGATRPPVHYVILSSWNSFGKYLKALLVPIEICLLPILFLMRFLYFFHKELSIVSVHLSLAIIFQYIFRFCATEDSWSVIPCHKPSRPESFLSFFTLISRVSFFCFPSDSTTTVVKLSDTHTHTHVRAIPASSKIVAIVSFRDFTTRTCFKFPISFRVEPIVQPDFYITIFVQHDSNRQAVHCREWTRFPILKSYYFPSNSHFAALRPKTRKLSRVNKPPSVRRFLGISYKHENYLSPRLTTPYIRRPMNYVF